MEYPIPAVLRVLCHACESSAIALLPATISAGPSISRFAISWPRDSVAFLPWVYRVGEQNMESMWPTVLLFRGLVASERADVKACAHCALLTCSDDLGYAIKAEQKKCLR